MSLIGQMQDAREDGVGIPSGLILNDADGSCMIVVFTDAPLNAKNLDPKKEP